MLIGSFRGAEPQIYMGSFRGAEPLSHYLPLPLIKGKGIQVEDSSRDRVT